MKYLIMILLCFVGAVLLTLDRNGTRLSTEHLQSAIGPDFLQAIESTETLTALKILPKHHQTKEEKQGYHIVPTERQVDRSLTRAIKSCLLNDEHYYFDMTKKCEFVPEIGFVIPGDKERMIFASYCAKQIKFIEGHREILIDCDPIGDVMQQTFERAVR